MTATISATNGSGTSVPKTVLSPYSTAWQSRNVVHDLIGGGIAVSLVAPRLRNGDLKLLYESEATAYACVTLHKNATSFTLTETTRPSVAMTYVVDGQIEILLDDPMDRWIVTIGFQEIQP